MNVWQEYYLIHAFFSVAYFFIGWWMTRRIAVGSEARQVHGRFVFWWTWPAFAVGGFVAPFLGGDGPNGWHGMAGFMLLAGWLIGALQGGLVLLIRYTRGLTPDGQPVPAPNRGTIGPAA